PPDAIERDVERETRNRQPEAELAVDLTLGSEERGDRLTTFGGLVEQPAHQLGEDAAPPMRRQHADPRDAGGADRPTAGGDGRERVDRCTADDPAFVARGEGSVELDAESVAR